MTVSSVSSTLSPYQADTQSPWKQRIQDFKALQSALQSGDLSSAQQAFSALQKDQQNSTQAASSGNASSQNTQASQDFQTLQNALNSGDLSGAQQAFAALKKDMQSSGRVRHHHHHGASASSTTQPGDSITSTPATESVATALDIQA